MPRAHIVRACIFDAYGTIFNLESVLRGTHKALGTAGSKLLATWRAKQLEYAWVLSLSQNYHDFWRCTADALGYALALHRIDSSLREHLLENYETLYSYPDAQKTLLKIRNANAKAVILSNGTELMLERALQAAGLREFLDVVVSVDAVRSFKPDPAVYEIARCRLDLPASVIGFVSANAWDIAGARRAGFRTVWINRDDRPDEYDLAGNTHSCKSLSEAADYLLR